MLVTCCSAQLVLRRPIAALSLSLHRHVPSSFHRPHHHDTIARRPPTSPAVYFHRTTISFFDPHPTTAAVAAAAHCETITSSRTLIDPPTLFSSSLLVFAQTMPSPILPIANPASKPPIARSKQDLDGKIDVLIDDPTERLLISSQFEEEKLVSVGPLLSRSSSYNSVAPAAASGYNQHQHQRRRRFGSDGSLPSLIGDGQRRGFGRQVEDGASESTSAGRFSLKLLKYLG